MVTTPENANNIASYKWELLDVVTAESGTEAGTGKTLTVTKDMKGKYIKLTVTDSEGKTYTAQSTAAVTENNTDDVSIINNSGFQSDGTAYVTDTLQVSYGSSFGVPQSITWYLNDTVVKNATANTAAGTLDLTLPLAGVGKTGTVYAVVVDGKGVSHTSKNTVSVVDSLLATSIKSFEIKNDYETPTISVSKTDGNAIASITMSKKVPGNLYIFKKGVEYKEGNKLGAVMALGNCVNVTYKANFTTKNLESQATPASGIWYADDDGTAHIMWDLAGTPTRGTEYVVVFDQTSVNDDDIGTSVNEKANIFADAAKAPYLDAPDGLELSNPGAGNTSYKMTFKKGTKAYAGLTTAAATNIAATTVFTKAKKDDTNGTAVGTVNAKIENGVVTQDGLTSAVQGAYYYAVANVKEGIFGAEKFTLTSETVACGTPVTKKVKIEKNATTSTTADVSFEAVADAATVYVTLDATKFSATDSSTYSNSAKVEKGATKVSITDAFKEAGTWYAVVVPDDATTYAKVVSDSGYTYASGKAETIQFAEVTGLTNTSETKTLASKLVGTDAWGNTASITPVAANANTIYPLDETSIGVNAEVAGTAVPTVDVAADGTIKVKTAGAALKDEAYYVILDKGGLVLQCTTPGSADSSVWKLSYTDKPLAVYASNNTAGGATATTGAANLKAVHSLLATSGWTVKINANQTLDTSVTKIASDATLKVIDGTLTIGHAIENNGTINIDGTQWTAGGTLTNYPGTTGTAGDGIAIGGSATITNKGSIRIASGQWAGACTIANTGSLYVADGAMFDPLGAATVNNNADGVITLNETALVAGCGDSALGTWNTTTGTWKLGDGVAANNGAVLDQILNGTITNGVTIDVNTDATTAAASTLPAGGKLTVAKGATLDVTPANFGNLGDITINGTLTTGTSNFQNGKVAAGTGSATATATLTNNGVVTAATATFINDAVVVNKGVATGTSFAGLTCNAGSAFYDQSVETTLAGREVTLGGKAKVGYSSDKCITIDPTVADYPLYDYTSANIAFRVTTPAQTKSITTPATATVTYVGGTTGWTITIGD